MNFRLQLREAHGQSAAPAENLTGARTRDASEGAMFQRGPKEIRKAAPEGPKVDPSTVCFAGPDTAGDCQTIPAPRGAEAIGAYHGHAERTEQEAATSATTKASKFPRSKTSRILGGNVDARFAEDGIPKETATKAKQQDAPPEPPRPSLFRGKICPECNIATCEDKQGACATFRRYIRRLAPKRKMTTNEFRAKANQPERENQPDREEQPTFKRSAVDREGTFKTTDEVVEMNTFNSTDEASRPSQRRNTTTNGIPP